MNEELVPKPEPLPDDVREIVASQLGTFVDEWKAKAPADRESVAREIHNELVTASVPGDDDEARQAYTTATRAIIAEGIMTKKELDEFVKGIRTDHGL